MKRTSTYTYDTISSTMRVNHVTTFKNAPFFFQMDATEDIKTHIGTDYIACIDLNKLTITVEPIENHIK